MKKLFFLIFISFIIFLTHCKKDQNDTPNNNNNPNGIIIKGNITRNGVNALSNAKKILVFNGMEGFGLKMSFANIVNGTFSDTLEMGSMVAMVFLDSNYKYIGTLCNQGINIIPLCKLNNDDSTVIDLSTLTLLGTSIIPSHDPFGNEIIITEAELNSLKVLSSFFESLAKNIDADNDGKLDMLSNKQIYIKSHFCISGGKYGFNSNAPIIKDSATNTITYNTYINGEMGFTFPSSSTMTGPEGDPYPTIFMGHMQPLDSSGHGFSSGWGVGNEAFKAGIYKLTLDGIPYTLSFSNLGAEYNLVFAAPTLITDNTGKLVTINLTYMHSDYTSIDPENIITSMMIQLNDSTCNRLFDSPWLNSKHGATTQDGNSVIGLYRYNLTTPLDISTLAYIDIIYNDLLSNLYFIQWRKK